MSEENEERAPVPGTPAGGTGKPAVQVVNGAVRDFLDGVRTALSDLPPGEVDEILDEVRAHLSELAAELGKEPDREALTARLGTPQAYAGELRAAAGYPPPPAPGPGESNGRTAARLAVLGLVASTVVVPLALLAGSEIGVVLGLLGVPLALPALFREGPRMTAVAELPELQAPLAGIRRIRSGFLGDLQSAWWVLRALAAALVVAWVVLEPGPLAVVLLAVLAVPASVWLGRLTRADRRWLWLVVPLNALAVAVVLLMALRAEPSPAYDGTEYVSSSGLSGLVQDGEPIWDIRPVDAAGNPLTDVYLFDQDGRPITTEEYGCDGAYGAYDASGYPSAGPVRPYPRGTWEVDPDTGRCVLVPPAPLVVAVPTVTASTAPTSVPSGVATATAVPAPVEPTAGAPVVAPTPTG